jgi:iron(III) transport system substrate-binding protein
VFKDIVTTNGVSVRKGHTLLTQLCAVGRDSARAHRLQLQGGAAQEQGRADRLVHHRARDREAQRHRRRREGATSACRGAFLRLSRSARKGQKILATRDFVPTNKKIDTPLNKIPMKFVDARVALDEYQKWEKLYDELFRKAK